ncbi:MAG: hypothetical protein KF823_16495 [Xanthomonadales bacterium]|nr:hypothetical protein [Xanthomonadales bacterium]
MPTPTEPQRAALQRECPPPPALRARLLARHARRRRLRAVALLAVPLLLGVGLLAPLTGGSDTAAAWRQVAALEAAWRTEADFDWLQRDARARHLVDELRRLDEALARDPDVTAADTLWQARGRVLSELLASRRDGRTAIAM